MNTHLTKVKSFAKKHQTALVVTGVAVIGIVSLTVTRRLERELRNQALAFIVEKGLGNEFLVNIIEV